MSIFKRLFSRKKKEITPLKVERVGLEWRRKKAAKKLYIAKVAITYEGRPIRQFDVNVKGFNRDNAAYKINNDLGVKLLSVVKNKKQKP